MTIEGGTAIVLAYVLVSNGSSFGCASTAANSAERRRVTYPSINRALTMWCDHPGTKAVAFLVNHVNRASHLRSAPNREPPPRPWRQAVLSMIPSAFWRWWDQRSVWPLGSPI